MRISMLFNVWDVLKLLHTYDPGTGFFLRDFFLLYSVLCFPYKISEHSYDLLFIAVNSVSVPHPPTVSSCQSQVCILYVPILKMG